ncbi:MAG: ion channel [Candidatus Binataceae bacterium]
MALNTRGKARSLIGTDTGYAVITRGVGRAYLTDLYYFLLTASWSFLLFLIAAAFGFANTIFALLYLLDGGIEHARPGSFADVFFFSVETMATIGYGKMSPVTLVANALMSFEALIGLIGLALVTGLIFAKFSRPNARVRFSRVAVIAKRDGVPCLMFRMANVRSNQIVEAQLHAVLARQEVTTEGESMRRFYDLELARQRNAIFALSWTAIHPIDEKSPFFGADPRLLTEWDATVVVSLIGLDATFAQTIHARHYYEPEDIIWGARYADIMEFLPDGTTVLDYARFDDTVAVELAMPSPVALDQRAPAN